jgi:hypothetical protein
MLKATGPEAIAPGFFFSGVPQPFARKDKSVRTESLTNPSYLRTSEGELLHLSLSVDLRRLEPLLDTLDGLPFPVNPEIVHPLQEASSVDVNFPAYERRLPGLITTLEQAGFTRDLLTVRGALSA